MTKRIRKAVFPVAGLGTRVLPATKSVPKEMLTVVDRPVLQHCVDEAREAGIEHFVFVTGRNKAVIEDHFDMAYELEDTLQRRGKKKEYDALMADLDTYLADNVQAWELRRDGRYERVTPARDRDATSAQPKLLRQLAEAS